MFSSISIYAQVQPDGSDIQDVIENNAQQSESETFDYDAYIDELENFKTHPLNLNKASAEDLANFPLLNAQQISNLLDHIARNGQLLSVYELQGVSGFDLDLINRMLPYILVDNDVNDIRVPIKKLLSKGNFVFISRYKQIIEKSDGYTRTDGKGYSGKPFNLFARFRYTYGTKLSYGITAEKDAGEQFFKGSNKQGFDYYSGHLFLRNFKALKALALGDYEVRLGQGLLIWSGFGVRKSPAVMNVKREGMKLRPYTSVNEYNFMRGAAFTVGAKGFEFTAFGSFKQVDANIVTSVDTSINADEAFSSFNESGFHRTAAEIADRNSINQLVTGGNFSYNKRKWHVGVNGLYMNNFKQYQRTLYPYNQFDLNKSWLVNASVDYHAIVKNFHFFGEEAISDNGGFGLLNGVMISLDQKVDVSLVHRYYSRNFQTSFSNAFAEASRPQNENGLYLAISIKPIRTIRLDGYFDLYMSRWLKFLTDAPSWGSDNFLQATFTPNKKFEMYLRYRFELKKKNMTDNDGPFDYLVNEQRQALRYNIKYKVTDYLTLANRIEWSNYKSGNTKAENGFVIYQDVNFRLMKFPISFNARLAIFKTASYSSRVYAYENDVLYSFSIPAYYGNGLRYYLTVRYAATRNIDIWARFAQTLQFDTPTTGSGLDELPGQHKSEIKLQVRFRF
ncbi:MAG: helix-hairpin-helix domain-containing protein [Chitinophagales bacterium]